MIISKKINIFICKNSNIQNYMSDAINQRIFSGDCIIALKNNSFPSRFELFSHSSNAPDKIVVSIFGSVLSTISFYEESYLKLTKAIEFILQLQI